MPATPAPRTGPTTVPAALAARLRGDAAQPLVTFYDDASGERVELSVTTYANWVAKTAGLLTDELDAERGGLLLVDLPAHWLGAVWLGAAWTVGMRVTDDPAVLADDAAERPDLVVCGPDGLDRYAGGGGPSAGAAGAAGSVPVVALSLRPLGAPFTEPLPAGTVDYGAVVLGQPDVFVPLDPPEADDPAWVGGGTTLTQADLLAGPGAPEALGLAAGGRLLTDVAPTGRDGLATLLAPLVAGGGTVWVRHADPAGWEARAAAERATTVLRSDRTD